MLTVSEFSRAEIEERLGVPGERIAVVPNGVAERFFAGRGRGRERGPARTALGLERPYVLALSTRIARKNLGVLAAAERALAGQGIELVSAGSGRHYMNEGSRRPGARSGTCPRSSASGLYAGAAALAMPSVYEGFGLPVLEAMASGTPVVAASSAALPEVCGGAALLADPHDPDAFAAELLRAVGPERDRLAAAGRERAAGFSWERSARTGGRRDRRSLLG